METSAPVAPPPRLRPGWRIPLTMLAMVGFVAVGVVTSALVGLTPAPPPVIRFAGLLGMTAGGIGVVVLLCRLVDRRGWRLAGLTARPRDLLGLPLGGILAAVVLLTAHLIAVALGLATWNPSFDDALPLGWGLALGYLMILLGQAFPEELLWRGYLFASLSAQWRRWPVIAATSIGFGVMHLISNPNTTAGIGWRLVYVLMACGLGFALAACRVRGSVWLAVGFHAGHNLTGTVLDSGAYDASLLVNLVVFVGFGLLLLVSSGRYRSPQRVT